MRINNRNITFLDVEIAWVRYNIVTMFVSVVIPVQNEEENILPLGQEISRAFALRNFSWESIWINDHSTDQTRTRLADLSKSDSRHTVIDLSSGNGQSAALAEGFRYAKGELFATIDGDGQNDPADIPMLIDHLVTHRVDMVTGRRLKRHDDLLRKIVSPLGNLFRNWVTGENLHDVGCGLRVFRRQCVEDLSIRNSIRGMHRFMPSVARLNGCRRIEEIPVNHRPRSTGQSKYTALNRLPEFIRDTIVVGRRLNSLPPNPHTRRRGSLDRRRP